LDLTTKNTNPEQKPWFLRHWAEKKGVFTGGTNVKKKKSRANGERPRRQRRRAESKGKRQMRVRKKGVRELGPIFFSKKNQHGFRADPSDVIERKKKKGKQNIPLRRSFRKSESPSFLR